MFNITGRPCGGLALPELRSRCFRVFATVLVVSCLAALTPIGGGAAPAAVPPAPSRAPGMSPVSRAQALSFKDRVLHQRRIEEVYWGHRIWPKENPGAKPPLDVVLPDARLRARVEDYLKKSNALEALWGRPITAAQLQAEVDRMAAESRAPEVLREIFEALGNDPFVIAETLARQTLADRLIRSWYAHDERFHGDLRREAEAALADVTSGAELPALGAEYAETTWRLKGEDDTDEGRKPDEIVLDAEEWEEQLARLARQLGSERESGRPIEIGPGRVAAPVQRTAAERIDALPVMTLSALHEEDGAFFVTSVVKKGPDAVTVATTSWPKTPFDAWWAERRVGTSADLAPVEGEFVLTEVTASGTCVPDSWQLLQNDTVPPARFRHTAVWTGSEMIVWGGQELSTGGRYNPSTDSWVATSTTGAPSGRVLHTAVWTGSEMIVWGGGDDWDIYYNTGGRYDPSNDSWVATATTGAPTARDYHTAVWTGSEMVIWGGYSDYDDYDVLFNTGGRYDPSTDSWVATATTDAPSERALHAAVWTGSEMIVWGGGDFGGYLNTGGRYAPSTDSWVATATAGAPSARYEHTAVWTGSEMIVWGGDDDSYVFNTGGRYDPSGDSWVTTTTSGASSERAGHTAVWTGSEMIVWGGHAGNDSFNTGGRYDPSGDSWATTSSAGAPSARYEHTALWTGSEMIVWGGYDNTGGRYDPSSDTWVVTTTGDAPFPRSGHMALWTGSEMIVWGGRDREPLNTGERYDPSTDSWVATTIAGAPIARVDHTAVWTGSEMIVWGGYDGSGVMNTGGRYNPSGDGWVATTTTGAPTWRYKHTAVWTGSEMIAWGGWGHYDLGGGNWTSSKLNTGGRYDPSSDSWVATTTSDAPSARYEHTAVWTGTEMIVWGGQRDGQDPFGIYHENTGARYNPSSGSWMATTTTGAPARRGRHAAVWTGTEMIVWGGRWYMPGWYSLDSGGRYDPSSNSWVATTTTGAPTARGEPTVVWTGSEMIVWGGEFPLTNTGGRYGPSGDSWVTTTTSGAPSERAGHTAVWTGSEMIVWGGSAGPSSLLTGGRYCVSSCDALSMWYPDADGDGYGVGSTGVPSCTQPPGYVAAGGDCNDGNPNCTTDCSDVDGDDYCDDNCPSVANGLQRDSDSDLVGDACDCAPEDPGSSTMLGPAEHLRFVTRTDLAWDPPADDGGGGGLTYDLLRAVGAADWQGVICPETDISATTASDTETPAGVFFYLVRVKSACGENLGTTSTEQRRAGTCASPA